VQSPKLNDTVVAFAALLFWSPAILVISAALLVEGGRPLVQRGGHITRQGRLIHSVRFRTELGHVGRVLKSTGLDALPQYAEVLRGRLALSDVDRKFRTLRLG
jgi:lipopolysaccharide/colanic/teichoic acid biosynthesis glycosyltransferase